MNKVILIGRTTKDIELFTLQSGVAITSFNLAVPREYKNQDGNIDSDFISCTASGKIAETFVNDTIRMYKKRNLEMYKIVHENILKIHSFLIY